MIKELGKLNARDDKEDVLGHTIEVPTMKEGEETKKKQKADS